MRGLAERSGGLGGDHREVSDGTRESAFPNTILDLAGTGTVLGGDREVTGRGGPFGEHFGGSLWRALWGGLGIALESTLGRFGGRFGEHVGDVM